LVRKGGFTYWPSRFRGVGVSREQMPRVLHIIGPSKGYGYPIFESENP